MRHYSLFLFLLLIGCKTTALNQNDIKTNSEVFGTVTSAFERFIFTPLEVGEVPALNDNVSWVSNDSRQAEDGDILFSIHDRLMQGSEWKGFQICVSGIATIKSAEKDTQPDFGRGTGFGHLGQWYSEITFTRIISAEAGKCKTT